VDCLHEVEHAAERIVLPERSIDTAIEVKSGRSPDARSGLTAFGEAFKPQRKMLVGGDGITMEAFLSHPVPFWVKRNGKKRDGGCTSAAARLKESRSHFSGLRLTSSIT
jgi:hypothetical protein